MIRLNPVQEGRESITRGLFPKRKDLATFVRSEEFKDILDTDAITVEGETKIAKYFNIETKWIRLLEEYEEDDGKTTLSGFKRYFELLFLVKSESKRDEVWFSFFEGMHRHAAIVAGLLCSKFNHMTNELKLGSLTLKDFSGDTVLKSYKDPGISVEDHLNKIMTKQLDPPMFTNTFHLSAYIPKHVIGDKQDATTFITGAIYQSTWISNFKQHSNTVQNTPVIAQDIDHCWEKATICCFKRKHQSVRSRLRFQNLNKKTGLRTNTLTVLEVTIGMATSETHST